jgi:hypothetical protein
MLTALHKLWDWFTGILNEIKELMWLVVSSSAFRAWIKILVLLVTTLIIGPILYLAYDWPYNLKPQNYFEFLNTGLLLFLVYHIILRKKDKLKCWLDDD